MNKKTLEDLFGRARSAFTIGDYDTAENLSRQILQHAARSVPPRILLGTIYSSRGRFAEAEAEFKRSLEIDPINCEALNNLGCLYRLQGRLNEAEGALKKALSQVGDRGDIHYNLGNVYKQRGDIDSAIECYTLAISHDPTFVLSYNNLGTLYELQGKTQRAIEIYLEGLTRDPNHPTLRYNLGIAYMNQGNLNEAESSFQQALKVKPGWVDGLNNLGIVLQRQERFDESLEVFREILEINPDNYTAQNNIATTLGKQGKTDEAIKYYKRALERNPHYEKAAINLGQMLENFEDNMAALKDLEGLVSRNPQNFELRLQLALKYYKMQQFKNAENLLLDLKEERQDSPEVLRALGLLYYQQGMNYEAEQCFFQLTALFPENLDYKLDVARILHSKGLLDEAIREIRDLVDLSPENLEASILLAELLLEAQQYTQARDFLEEAKHKFPDEGIILGLQAKTFQFLGNRVEALQAADELISLQGRRANPDDITALNESLELYEKAVEAFSGERGKAWQKNLDRLGALQIGVKAPEPFTSVLQYEQPAEVETDSVPILDFGDLKFEFTDEDGFELEEPLKPEVEEPIEEAEIEEDVVTKVGKAAEELPPSLMSMIDEAGASIEPPASRDGRRSEPQTPQSSTGAPPQPQPQPEYAPQPPHYPQYPQQPQFQQPPQYPQPPQYQQPPMHQPQPQYPQNPQPQYPMPPQPQYSASPPLQQPAPQYQPPPQQPQQQPQYQQPQQQYQQPAQQPYSQPPTPQTQQYQQPQQPAQQQPQYPEPRQQPGKPHPQRPAANPPGQSGSPLRMDPDLESAPEAESEIGEFPLDEFMGTPEPELDLLPESGNSLSPSDDPIFEDINEPGLPDQDGFLPDNSELSLDDEIFNPESGAELDDLILDGELEPDEAITDDYFADAELEDTADDWLQGYEEPEIEEPQFFPEELAETIDIPEELPSEIPGPSEMSPEPETLLPVIENPPPPKPMATVATPMPYSEPQTMQPDSLPPGAKPAIATTTVDNVAKAKLFEYLLSLTKDLPGEKAREAEEKRLPERLENIRNVLLDKEPVAPAIRTGKDRRKGPRRIEGTAPAAPASEDDVFVDTFSMLGKIGQFLPSDQKLELRDRMKKIIAVMEKYRR